MPFHWGLVPGVLRQHGGATFQHLTLAEETTSLSKWQAPLTRSCGAVLWKKGHNNQDGSMHLPANYYKSL
jgi:hypothetical protein